MITIIMPCYYSSEIIKKAFDSIAQQTKKDFIQVIMVNDCSPNTDCNYLDLREEFKNKISLQYYKTEVNSGPGVARQIGLNHCNTPWVMFLDDDDMLNNPYVIETYLNIINESQKSNQICYIESNALYLNYNLENQVNIPTICGNIYNMNFIKLFNITFDKDISFYEEDKIFINKYYYYTEKLINSNIGIKINMNKIQPDFIAYTKDNTNVKSICSTITEKEQCKKILQAYTILFQFYNQLSLEDNFTLNYIKQILPNDIKYLNDFCFKSIISQNYIIEMHDIINEFYNQFQLLKSLYKDIDYNLLDLTFYNIIINTLYGNNISLNYKNNDKIITIIMPCYYSSEIIKKALTMLSWQTKKDFIEVIMINDCSPNTECEYQDLIDEFQSKLSLKYYKTEVNSGPGIARQIGLNNCNTQWVMFHDDDDMLNNPYVIETYLNVINNIPDNIIVSAINGPHLEYQTFSNNFIKDNHNFTGNLFNNNIIKLFDIQYPDLSYEEDRYFAMQYYYCVNRISTYFPYLQIQEINIIDNNSNFIAYTKQYNNQSICSSLTEQKRIDKALEFLYHTFTFYMNIPKDELLFKLLNNNLIYDFYYIVQWISYIDNYQFSDQQKTKILLIDEYLQTLLEFSGLKLPIDLSETYINFIKQLNN